VYGTEHPECAEILNALGLIEKKKGNYARATELYETSVKIQEKAFGANHPKVCIT
jgi:hypothetical protein